MRNLERANIIKVSVSAVELKGQYHLVAIPKVTARGTEDKYFNENP